jgi:hypothetical protein
MKDGCGSRRSAGRAARFKILKGVIEMYAKPALERFGTLRELTLLGADNNSDGVGALGVVSPGCSTTALGITVNLGCS